MNKKILLLLPLFMFNFLSAQDYFYKIKKEIPVKNFNSSSAVVESGSGYIITILTEIEGEPPREFIFTYAAE